MAGTGTAYPADAVTGSPTFAALQGRNAFSAAMAGATSARPLGGITGVRPGTPSNTITATSTTWTMNPNGFAGYIDLEASVTNSGYFFAFTGTITGAVTAAGGTARQDIVWVQIADSNTSDGSTGAPRVIIDYTANTLTPPARAFVIAILNVPASGGGSPTVSWVAPYTAAAGGLLYCNTYSQLPTSANVGDKCQTYDTQIVYRWNGTAWKGWDGDWQTITLASAVASGLASGASGTSTFQWRYHSGRVVYKGAVTIQSGGSWVSPILNLPVPAVVPWYANKKYDTGGGAIYDVSAGQIYSLIVFANGSSATQVSLAVAGANTTPAGAISNSSPFANAVGDSLSFELEYDPA